jgi:FAD/FMN-containing dehydrogenase
LPIDPAGNPTIRALLADNLSGPRRYGNGTIREHILGLRARLADGRVIHSGGRVVKNVAGYDLGKLFIGSHGKLGEIIEATFKLQPLPETERIVALRCESLRHAGQRLDELSERNISPVILDLHNSGGTQIVIGFAGASEDVDWQLAQFREATPATLDYFTGFKPQHRQSCLPAKICEVIAASGATDYVAHAGDGVILYRGGTPPPPERLPVELMRRIEAAFR